MRFSLWLFTSLVLVGCGAGSNAEGPIQGYLILQRPDGSKADFSLGGTKTLTGCGKMVAFELRAADEDNHGEFWTNPEFNIGGHKQEGWERNIVLGGRCEHEASSR